MSYEWPLLVFTFLAEAAVGTFICAGCAQLVFSRRSEEANRALFLPLLAASPVVLCIGLVASLMHLGQVVGAPSALLNIGSSWLSREILFGSLALVGFVVTVVVSRKSFGTVGVIAWGGIYGNRPCFSRERGQRVPASHRSVVEHDGNASFDDRGSGYGGVRRRERVRSVR